MERVFSSVLLAAVTSASLAHNGQLKQIIKKGIIARMKTSNRQSNCYITRITRQKVAPV
jgi:hypothetical protein